MKTLEDARSQYRDWLKAKGYSDPFEGVEAKAYRAGRLAQAEEDAVGVLTVKPAFISGFPDVTGTLNRAAAAIRANIAKLKDEARASTKEGE
jgi:hypothetical protein